MQRIARMSIIEEQPVRQIRMAHLATIGSHVVNGVAELQSRLLREVILKDFAEMWPEKFQNKTNGVTPRRFMRLANPALSQLITSKIGDGWLTDLEQLAKLEQYADEPRFQASWRDVKQQNKQRLATLLQQTCGVVVNVDSMFDIMVKRLHEYKRQLLKALHIIWLYHRVKANPQMSLTPRTFVFGAKAAPGYFMAKRIIKLIHCLAHVINDDPEVNGRLKIVFPANFNVSMAERIYPAADLSEQISLAGKEASGTGNMKFALNGAVTIGTLDGANVEIRERVGAENFFQFGLDADQVLRMEQQGYNPLSYYEHDGELKAAVDAIALGQFSHGDKDVFRPLVDALLTRDEYMLLADFRSYVDRIRDGRLRVPGS